MAKLCSDLHRTCKITCLYFKEFPCCVSEQLLSNNKALVSLTVESVMQAKPRDATSSFSAFHSITLTSAIGRKTWSIHQQCPFTSHTPLSYWVELFSWGKYKILLPNALKLFSEYPSLHHPSWFQRTQSHSMGVLRRSRLSSKCQVCMFSMGRHLSVTGCRKTNPTTQTLRTGKTIHSVWEIVGKPDD